MPEQCRLSFLLSSPSLVDENVHFLMTKGKGGSVPCLITVMMHSLEDFLSDTFGRMKQFTKMRKRKKIERKAETYKGRSEDFQI